MIQPWPTALVCICAADVMQANLDSTSSDLGPNSLDLLYIHTYVGVDCALYIRAHAACWTQSVRLWHAGRWESENVSQCNTADDGVTRVECHSGFGDQASHHPQRVKVSLSPPCRLAEGWTSASRLQCSAHCLCLEQIIWRRFVDLWGRLAFEMSCNRTVTSTIWRVIPHVLSPQPLPGFLAPGKVWWGFSFSLWFFLWGSHPTAHWGFPVIIVVMKAKAETHVVKLFYLVVDGMALRTNVDQLVQHFLKTCRFGYWT